MVLVTTIVKTHLTTIVKTQTIRKPKGSTISKQKKTTRLYIFREEILHNVEKVALYF